MKYDFLLFDVDDTLLDFVGCEYPAFKQALSNNGIEVSEEDFEVYKLINHELWQHFESGVYSKKEILTLRFDLLFVQIGVFGDAAQVSHDYLVAMGEHIEYEPGAKELLDSIKGEATMVIITNGAELAQRGKIKHTGLDAYFDYIFVSDEAGFHKPQQQFFDMVSAKVDGFDKNKALIIGDGLQSDILGGMNYGIDTVWYNKWKKSMPEEIKPTHIIEDMTKLQEILMK